MNPRRKPCYIFLTGKQFVALSGIMLHYLMRISDHQITPEDVEIKKLINGIIDARGKATPADSVMVRKEKKK